MKCFQFLENDKITLKYIDTDEDTITITNNQDLTAAYNEF